MNCKIKETEEVKKLEMIDSDSGADNIVDFVGNNGGFANGNFVYDNGSDTQAVSLADYEWWRNVIELHSALDRRINELMKEHGCAEVIDAIDGAYERDLEDQPVVAHSMLNAAFGVEK